MALAPALVCWAGFSASAERIVLDFKDQVPGSELPSAVDDAHLMALNAPKIAFLSAETSPPSPFPDGVHSLLVEQGDDSNARVRVRIKPFFASTVPKVGWVELELVVNSLTHNGVEIGSGGGSGLASAQNPVFEGKVILGLNLNVENPVDVVTFPTESRKERKQGSPSPVKGVPFRLRIAWDFSGEIPTISLLINGEVLQDLSGGNLILEIPKEEVHDGVDYLSLMLRNAILGRIIASE